MKSMTRILQGHTTHTNGAFGLRWSWCDEVDGAHIDHTGWFADEYGDGNTIRGIVFRLPRGRGFLAGWSMGGNMVTVVDGHIWADEVDAALAADIEAESVAQADLARFLSSLAIA